MHEIQKGLVLIQDKLSIVISMFSGLQWKKTRNALCFLRSTQQNMIGNHRELETSCWFAYFLWRFTKTDKWMLHAEKN